MLETRYHKDMNHNYLIMKCHGEPKGDKYQLRMITENKIPGLLGCSTRYINGDVYLYYEVNSMQDLKSLYEYKTMDKTQAIHILAEFKKVLRELQSFLLLDSRLLVRPEYIYINWEAEEIRFIYYPYENGWEENAVLVLLEFLVKVIDHQDKQLVDMVYHLYQLAENGRFVVNELDYYDGTRLRDSGRNERFQQIQKPLSGENMYEKAEHRPIYDDAERSGSSDITPICDASAIEPPVFVPPTYVSQDNFSPDFRTPDFRSPDFRAPDFRSPDFRTPDFRSPDFRSSDFRSPDFRTPDSYSSESHSPNFVSPIDKKQKFKFVIMSVISAAGAAVVLYIKSRYLLEPQEVLITWILLFTFVFILFITVILYLLLKFSLCTEKNPLGNIYHGDGEKEKENDDYSAAEKTEEVPEKIGDTVFLYSAEEARENKLYGVHHGSKYLIDLKTLPCTIGKMAECVDYCIEETSISRMHVKFTEKDNQVYMTDLNSTNGTYKNGLRLDPSETVLLESGDEIRLGKLIFYYR